MNGLLRCLLLLGLAGWLLACSETMPSSTPTPETPPSIRVATVNLLHGFNSETDAATLPERLDLVAEALGREGVDIVGVQEASITSYGGNVAEELARKLDFAFVYQRSNPSLLPLSVEENEQLIRDLDFEEGSAVLSRFPIIEVASIELPRVSDQENRIGVRATVDTPWGALDAYVTHLTNAPDPSSKVEQARALAEWITSRPRARPAILMGDFNALEGSEPIELLTERFLDVYRAVHPQTPGFTCCQEALLDPEPATERKRIDYLFLAPGREFAGEVVAAYVFLDAPVRIPDGRDLWASDHFGVLAEIRLFP